MTDAERVPLAAKGDLKACEQLYATYYRTAVSIAKKIGAGDHAEDAGQLVFVWLLTGRWRLDELRPSADGRLDSFVGTLTRYATWKLMYTGSKLAQLFDVSDEDRDVLAEVPCPDPTPEETTMRRERQRRLSAALHSLPPHLRRVARLRYFEDLSGPDIAEDVGVGATTIPGYLGLIRSRLRAALADVYRLPPPDAGRTRGGHRRLANRAREAR
jgi:RNA polymerase sigma factor (sigma-70 family)